MAIIHMNPTTMQPSEAPPKEETAATLHPHSLLLNQLKKELAAKNDELYSVQVQVLHAQWAPEAAADKPCVLRALETRTPCMKTLVDQAAKLEEETQVLFEEYQTVRRDGLTKRPPRRLVNKEKPTKLKQAAQEVDADEQYEVGDCVAVVCDDEKDGFEHGEVGLVAEIDTTITYPYRVQSTHRPRARHGYFKACALRLVEQPKPTFSPYTPRKTNDEIDLEKGLAHSKHVKNVKAAIAHSIKNFVISM